MLKFLGGLVFSAALLVIAPQAHAESVAPNPLPKLGSIELSHSGDVVAGTRMMISWEAASIDIGYVDIYFEQDLVKTPIATQVRATKNQIMWTVPDTVTETARIWIYGTDLVDTLASVSSSAFNIVPKEGVRILPDIRPGDAITLEDHDEVYAVTPDYTRRVFVNEPTFYTWHADAEDIKTVESEEMQAIEFEGLMLPKPETVLVRFTEESRVYALTDNDENLVPELNHLLDARTAYDIYGGEWEASVLVLDQAIKDAFEMGQTISRLSHFEVDRSQLLRVEHLR